MEDKFEDIFKESGLDYAKEYGLFKTKYTCGKVTLEVSDATATIFDGDSFYSAPKSSPTIIDYLRSVLCELQKQH